MDPITNIPELLEAIDTYYVTPVTEKITGVETNAILHAMIELLPPAEATLTDEEIKAYLMSLPGYGPGKMLASDFTWLSYDQGLPQLSAVSGFSLGAPAGTSVNIAWDNVTNADAYILQRDSSQAFPSPATIYTGSDTGFTASGLSSGFTYFFRIKAIAFNYQDSAFVIASTTIP